MAKINEVEIIYRNKYRNYYKDINKYFVSKKGIEKDFNWDSKCYVPIGATIALLSEGSSNPNVIMSIINDAAVVASLCGWRANNKKIIKISEEKETNILNLLSYEPMIFIDDIYKKIGHGTYLECEMKSLENVFDFEVDGVLLSIEYDVNTSQLELRANIVLKNKKVMPFILHLKDKNFLTEGIEDTLHFTSEAIKTEIKNNKINDINLIRALKELKENDRVYLLNYVIFSNILVMLENI